MTDMGQVTVHIDIVATYFYEYKSKNNYSLWMESHTARC